MSTTNIRRSRITSLLLAEALPKHFSTSWKLQDANFYLTEETKPKQRNFNTEPQIFKE